MTDQIDDKTRAQVMRDAADDAEARGLSVVAAVMRKWADAQDSPEAPFEDGDYAVWSRRGTRHLAIRDAKNDSHFPWWVGVTPYTDDRMREGFTRIEKLRTVADDEVIIKREDVREAFDALGAAVYGTRCTGTDCAGCQAGRAQMRLRRALNEQGGESR